MALSPFAKSILLWLALAALAVSSGIEELDATSSLEEGLVDDLQESELGDRRWDDGGFTLDDADAELGCGALLHPRLHSHSSPQLVRIAVGE